MVRGMVCGSSGEPPMVTRVSNGGKRVRMGNDRVRVGMSGLVRPGASCVQKLAAVVVKRR